MKSMLKAPGTDRLKLKHSRTASKYLLSNYHLHRYNKAALLVKAAAAATAPLKSKAAMMVKPRLPQYLMRPRQYLQQWSTYMFTPEAGAYTRPLLSST